MSPVSGPSRLMHIAQDIPPQLHENLHCIYLLSIRTLTGGQLSSPGALSLADAPAVADQLVLVRARVLGHRAVEGGTRREADGADGRLWRRTAVDVLAGGRQTRPAACVQTGPLGGTRHLRRRGVLDRTVTSRSWCIIWQEDVHT